MFAIVQDKFTGANGTALAAHTPDIGGPWTDSGVGLQLSGNKVTGTDAQGISTIPINKKTARAFITLDKNGMDAGSIVSVRIANAVNGYALTMKIFGNDDFVLDQYGNAGADFVSMSGTVAGMGAVQKLMLALTPGEAVVLVNSRVIYRAKKIYDPGDLLVALLRLEINRGAGTFPTFDDLVITN